MSAAGADPTTCNHNSEVRLEGGQQTVEVSMKSSRSNKGDTAT